LASLLEEEAKLLETLKQALAHYQNKEYEPAKVLCAEVLAQAPTRADALTLMGILYRKEDDFERAEHYYLEALKNAPEYADALNNLGNLARERGRLEEAITHYQRALELRPEWAEGYDHLGSVLHSLNRVPEALAAFEKSLALDPNYADAHWDRALALLASGRYREGWAEYAWRWQRRQPIPRDFKEPVWDGKVDLTGKRILIYGEQGYGDVIQFLRFVPLVKARGATVLLEVYDIVAPLVPSDLGADVVLVAGRPLPSFDVQVALLDLPRLLGIELADLPGHLPYLAVPPERRERWSQRLAATAGLKIGLVWAGNPNVKNDRWRSPRLAPLLPLLEVPGVTFFALQKGDGRRDIEGIGKRDNLVDLGDELNDFADTAAVIEQLDLVISTDTSVVHLAGGLGKPVWVVLHHSLDWRWTGNAAQAWYPSVSLYQQRVLGEWAEVVDRVVVDLQRRVAASSVESESDALVTDFPHCPLCRSQQLSPLGTYACTRHALYHPPLPPTLSWQRCGSCDHVFTRSYYSPAGLRELFSKAHAGQVAGGDLDAQRFVWSDVVERVLRVMGGNELVWKKPLHWLDVGCGNGGLVFAASEYGFDACGLDVREQAVEALRAFGYRAECGDLLGYRPAVAPDVVSLADVLEHIPYPGEALAHLEKIMAPGGVLFVSCPNMDCASWKAMDKNNQNPYWVEIEHHHNFSRQSLAALLRQHGFEPVDYGVSRRYKACMEIIAVRRGEKA
jgi:Tfp pilus assembly protein PilF/SAM-dependent methyltransferase